MLYPPFVVFLDIDGVLNSTRYWLESGQDLPIGRPGAIDKKAVERVNLVAARPDVLTVLSTSWRSQGTDTVAGYLGERGFRGSVIGQTPVVGNGPRSGEIVEWIVQARRLGFEMAGMIVIDDDPSASLADTEWRLRSHFVNTNYGVGLQDGEIGEAFAWIERMRSDHMVARRTR